jgi:hypothetical protein
VYSLGVLAYILTSCPKAFDRIFEEVIARLFEEEIARLSEMPKVSARSAYVTRVQSVETKLAPYSRQLLMTLEDQLKVSRFFAWPARYT